MPQHPDSRAEGRRLAIRRAHAFGKDHRVAAAIDGLARVSEALAHVESQKTEAPRLRVHDQYGTLGFSVPDSISTSIDPSLS
jgi:hypothetical protein